MPNWKKVIVSGSDAALNSLNVTSHFTASGLIYPTIDGTTGQVIITDGAGNLSFAPVENTAIVIKNVSGVTIPKGTPCYITSSGTSGNLAGVWPADAANPARMPAGVIAGETLNNGDEGIGLINGYIGNVNTSAFGAGDSIYVAAGGGYTNIRPTGSSILVQKLGNVEKSAINGSGVINGPAYYNDLPNIQSGYTWVGNNDGVAVAIATSSIQNVVSSSYALTASYTPSIAGTDNYIPRFNGSSALENSVMYDDGTNIGIGTTSPSTKLHVGAASVNQSSISTSNSTNLGLFVQAVGNDNVTGNLQSGITFGEGNSGLYSYDAGGSGAQGLSIFTGNFSSLTEKMCITNAGDVGIGTTSPQNYSGFVTLTVGDNSGSKLGLLKLRSNYNGGDGFEMYQNSSGLLYLNTNSGTTAMNITAAGNVGIGTTSPQTKLTLNGANVSYAGQLQIASNDFAQITFYDSAALTPGASNRKASLIYNVNGNTFEIANQITNGHLILQGSDSGGGNVGIGTDSPTQKLDVQGSIKASQSITIGSSGNYESGSIYSDSNWGMIFRAKQPSPVQAQFMWADSADNELMRIKNGNVGIGTSNPQTKLHIVATGAPNGITLEPSSGTESPEIRFITSTNHYNIDNSAGTLRFFTETGYGTGGVVRAVIDALGNVGIGTTSPTQLLTVNGAAGYLFTAQENSSNNVRFQVYVDANEVSLVSGYNTTAKPMTFYVSSSERMRIGTNGAMKFNAYGSGTFTGTATQKLAVDSSGNVIEIPIGAGPVDGSGTANYITRWVDTDTITTSSIYETGGNIGIGTTSPGVKFEVNSNSTLPIIRSRYDSTYYTDYDSNGIDFRGTSQTFDIKDNGTIAIRIASGGNVGIGTTSPAYKLSVVGKIALNDGGNSVFIGTNAGLSDDATANNNIAIGTNASQNNVSGSQNVAIGHNTLVNNTNINNTAVGSNALQNNTTALNNTAFGSYALNANTVGSSSIAVGAAALITNTTGNHNTGVGNSALRLNLTGSQNVGVGGSVMFNNTNGSDNVAIGWNSARYFGTGTSALTDTSGSIFLGTLARANASGEVNQIVIGMNALGLGSNTVVLGNDNVTTTALKGNVGIGTTSPNGKLEVNGSAYFGTFINTDIKYSFVSSGSVGSYHTYVNNTNSTGGTYGLGVNIANTSTNGYILGLSSGGTERMIVRNDGNVGIGTSSPSYKLDVDGGSDTTVARFYNSGTTSTILQLGDTGNSQYSEFIWNADTSVASIFKAGTAFSGYGGANSLNIYNQTGPISFHPNNISNAMTIASSGNIGIGTTSPSYLLDVNGTARVTTLIETSALKYKINIQPLEPQLSKVAQLEPVTFDWIDKPNPKTNIGLIADEVEKIYPEFVSKTEDGEIEGIEYSKLTTVLIQSIKELKEIVDKQQVQINTLLNK
jgi:hypothetical protein